MARRWTQTASTRGLPITFHDDMPSRVPDLTVAIEIVEGRHDDEATLIRNCHLFERAGRNQLPLTPRTLGERECMARIDAWMSPAVRIMEGEAAMRARGVDPLDPPLEELTANPLVRDIIAWADMHSSAYRVARTAQGGLTQPPGGMAHGRISMAPIKRGTDAEGFEIALDLCATRLHARRIALKGATWIRIVDVDELRVEITLSGVSAPDSVLAASPGRTLRHLMEHPMMHLSRDIEIVEAHNRHETLGGDHLVIIAKGAPVAAHPLLGGAAPCGS